MKKSLIALAILAAAGSASAQSSVTLFGIVDATLAYGRASGTGNASRWQLTNSGYNSSRIGFRGVEDLGGGMAAEFWLEAGLANDDGQGAATNTNNTATGAGAAVAGRQGLTFNRRSTVALKGGWGELRLGRDYSPQFWNLAVFDPFGYNGVGTTALQTGITGVTQVRASNSIGYFLPANLRGFYGQVAFYMGEQLNNAVAGGIRTDSDGDGIGVRVGYASGPFNVAVALSRTEYGAGDVKQNNIGGQWDFGVARLMGHAAWDKNGNIDGRGWLIGALVPMGPGEIRVSYSAYRTEVAGPDPRVRKIALGYVHNLSKRTALYTTYAHARNSNGNAVVLNGALLGVGGSRNSSGLDLGIRHSF
ncbi:porin [Ramlibacter sp.]|uniref:porin n=1 Tax=Ramlibacter sp. TaxID=1917967 RepID=UPI003D14AF6C